MLISIVETNNIESIHTCQKHVSVRKTSTCRNPFAHCPFHSFALGPWFYKFFFFLLFFFTKMRCSSVAIDGASTTKLLLIEETFRVYSYISEYFTPEFQIHRVLRPLLYPEILSWRCKHDCFFSKIYLYGININR